MAFFLCPPPKFHYIMQCVNYSPAAGLHLFTIATHDTKSIAKKCSTQFEHGALNRNKQFRPTGFSFCIALLVDFLQQVP